MDRWSGRDGRDDGDNAAAQRPAGQVARSGLGAFVKADTGMGSTETAQFRPATVTLSRREQAQAQQAVHTAQRVTASVAQRSTVAAPAAGPAGVNVPPWAADPPPGAILQATKDAVVVQMVPIQKKATLLGRLATADVQLDHASISRQHAMLCFRPDGTAVLMDLDSAHGSFVGGDRLPKHTPRELAEGEEMRFGASTRRYTLQRRPGSGGGDRSRKRSVSWPDEADDAGPDEKRQSTGNGLEQIIGYTDSKEFAVSVGPVAAAPDNPQGRFAGLVSQVVRPSPGKPAPPDGSHGPAQHAASGEQAPASGDSHAAKMKRLAQEEFKRYMEERGRKSSRVYDELPPPASGS